MESGFVFSHLLSSTVEDLSASVPILVGPNWILWEAQMKAYLCTKGLWQLVTGNEVRLRDLPAGWNAQTAQAATAEQPVREAIAAILFPTADQTAAHNKEQNDWDNKDDQAISIITLKISHSICTHIADHASETWMNLSMAFATPGPATAVEGCSLSSTTTLCHPQPPSATNGQPLYHSTCEQTPTTLCLPLPLLFEM